MGFCYGTGETLPTCGAWRFEQCGDDLGEMLVKINGELSTVIYHRKVEVAAYEAPILTRYDKLGPLRKTYSLGAHLEFVCKQANVPCFEVDLRAVKKELAGFAAADKDDMVAAAEKLGVHLPATDAAGRKDAADALGVWLLLLRSRSPRLSARFDAALWGSRGGLPF